MSTSPSSPIPIGSSGTGVVTIDPGARFTVQSMSRKSKGYLINDSEFDALEDIAAVSKGCWSLIAISISMILSALWDMGFTSGGDTKFSIGWCILWIAIGSTAVTVLVRRRDRRDRYIDRIKSESFEPTTP